ncbi:MAG: HNH endonuclease [Pseudomonadota bacterium]|nr:HNH endonuclease [Pseudomonadota bacterium]
MTQYTETAPAQFRADIQRDIVERLEWFCSRYDIVSLYAFQPGSDAVYLGDKSKRLCRYCGRAAPEVKFKKLAHAIPDQVGNDWLFDYEECDTCNGGFAKWVEDDFAKWTHPWRTLGRIKGKKGVPSIKSNDQKFRIDATVASTPAETGAGAVRHELKILMDVNDVRHEVDEANRTVRLTLDRPAYVPMGVFKCLVKMAIAIMPPEEEQRCDHLKKWILLPTHTFESYPYRPLRVLYQLAPGPLPNDRVACCLLRRKPDSADDCLYMQFILQLSNHVFQIALPMHIEDRKQLEARKSTTALWPNLWADVEHQARYGRTGHKEYDMSGVEAVRGEITSMVFSYDQLIDLPDTVVEPDGEPKAD